MINKGATDMATSLAEAFKRGSYEDLARIRDNTWDACYNDNKIDCNEKKALDDIAWGFLQLTDKPVEAIQ